MRRVYTFGEHVHAESAITMSDIPLFLLGTFYVPYVSLNENRVILMVIN